MMNMKGNKKFNEASDKAKKLCAELMCEKICDMSTDVLHLMQVILSYIDAMESIVAEREQTLKEINEKLDKLLTKEEGSK